MEVILLFTSNLNYIPFIILKTAEKNSPFLQIIPSPAKIAATTARPATQTGRTECKKTLTANAFFAILYKVYPGDVSKRS